MGSENAVGTGIQEDKQMFDKLIVSDATGADFKPRRSYFLVSSVVVGIMFLSAVVYSIFASDFGLGTNGFELAELLPPIDMAATENEPPKPRLPQTQSRSTSQMPTRQVNMPDLNENPIVPTSISVVRNTQPTRPLSGFIISDTNSDSTSNGSGRNTYGPGTGGPGLSDTTQVAETVKDTDPPPAIKAPPVKIVSGGVVNGNATSLPKPVYSAVAKALGAQGKVDVQVTIDESGKVISAKAISGNMLLRESAEKAAWGARFTPTLLSKVPVKVTGVIVYNFMRG